MKSTIAICFFMLGSLAFAKDKPIFRQAGTISNMDAVPCGIDENSGKSLPERSWEPMERTRNSARCSARNTC